MTYVFRTKYVALAAAWMMGMSSLYADMCAPVCEDNCWGNFWVSGDLLYLRGCEEGFGCDFGTTSITTTVSSGKVITGIVEDDEDLDFDWDIGYRVGAGYGFASSCWDTAVYWTHFNENGTGDDDGNHAKWRLRFNEVDAVLGYKLKYGSCFTLRPFFGARYARIRQSISTHLETTVLIAATGASSTVISTRDDRERFWGAGPLLGFEGAFDLGCGFSVYGNLAGNLLYGEFKNEFNDSDVFAAAINNCLSSSESCSVLKGIDAGIGVRYEMCYGILQLGLEHHTYFDYNQIGCGGDLNLYGINASVRVGF